MRRVLALALALAAALTVTPPSVAQQIEELEGPVVLRADEVTYDRDEGVVVAVGNVEASQGGRILLAEKIVYNQKIDKVVATGNVVILEPTGEVFFADYMELRDQFKNGLIEGIGMLFSDDSRLAANSAIRSDGNRTILHKAVFSPCELCQENRYRPPLWQIKATRVVHNQKSQRVDYYDAFLEVYGVPVAYTPFFSHPDPTVKRQTGFLVPGYGSSSDLGLKLELPFYWNIAPDKDVTITPLFTTKEGPVLGTEYRQRFHSGEIDFNGSITRPRERNDEGNLVGGRKFRGHVFGEGKFDLDETWRWGFDVARTTDDTYLRRYDIDSRDTLTSDLFVEGIRGRNYFSAEAFSFQGLREGDVSGRTPTIWPIISYSFVGEPSRIGGRYLLDFSMMQLTRTQGRDSRRLSVLAGWRLPYITPAGDVYSLTLDLRGDLYLVNNVATPNQGGDEFSGLTGRIRPRLALDWRYPFVSQQGSLRQVIEPLASFVLSPFGGNSEKIPNEDSLSFEFDDTNLFSHDRFPGLDRVEGGPRFNVGIAVGIYGEGGGSATALFGQTFRIEDDKDLPAETGIETERSDYVGRLVISPNQFVQYVHRFRLDRDDFGFRRNEVDVGLGPSYARLNVGFVSLSGAQGVEETLTRRELRASGHWEFADNWTTNGFLRRDLSENGGSIFFGLGLVYEDECFVFETTFRRDFTRDRDVKPSTSIDFRIKLKHLG